MSDDPLSPNSVPFNPQVAVIGTPSSDGDATCHHDAVPDPTVTRDQAERVADLFKVLGDPTRVLILRTLADAGEVCVRHLAEAVGTSQSSVSHHLRLLRATSLVRTRRVGREVYYRPDDEHVVQLIAICADHVAHAALAAASPAGTTAAAASEAAIHA